MNLSIVIPVYNEAANIRPLYERLQDALLQLGRVYEVIFVDDGSDDGTLATLRDVQRNDPTVRVIRFRKNFGQTAAMKAGIQYARGGMIVTMDGDLQNDPQDVSKLVAKIDEGYDLAIGWRRDRKVPLWSRTLPSKIANWLIGKITGVSVHDNGCSLKAYRSDMIKRVPLYSEMHRFIPAMSTTVGARIAEVVVRHHPRRWGKSKYGLSRVGKVLLDVIAVKMLIAFGQRPMHWFCAWSLPFILLSASCAVAYFILWCVGAPQAAGIVIPIALLLLTYLAAHFVFLGFMAELIVRTRRSRDTIAVGTVCRVEPAED